MVLSWYSWNWPLTKRSTKLDFPTADSPSSTSLNWQILLLAAVPLIRVVPPRPAIAPVLKMWRESPGVMGEYWFQFRPGSRAGRSSGSGVQVRFRQMTERVRTSPDGAAKPNIHWMSTQNDLVNDLLLDLHPKKITFLLTNCAASTDSVSLHQCPHLYLTSVASVQTQTRQVFFQTTSQLWNYTASFLILAFTKQIAKRTPEQTG